MPKIIKKINSKGRYPVQEVTREGMFETNSSSVHTIIYKSKRKKRIVLDPNDMEVSRTGKLRVPLKWFGKGYEKCFSQEEKLAYLLMLDFYRRVDEGKEEFKSQVEDMKDRACYALLLEDLKTVIPDLKDIVPVYVEGWGFDWQATSDFPSHLDFLGDNMSVCEFVFCPNIGIEIDCDG